MSKRAKNTAKTAVAGTPPTQDNAPTFAAQSPRKNAALLALSIVLFAAWFVFLLVTAMFG
jgi:hypothetical protein